MLARLMVLFLVVPILELALLMILADYTDWKFALALVILTGVSGAWLVRHQGWRALRRIQSEIQTGHLPADALIDGLLVLIAGILLLTPGILTDLAAIGLLIPFTRAIAKQRLRMWFQSRFTLHTVDARDADPNVARPTSDPQTFDVKAKRV